MPTTSAAALDEIVSALRRGDRDRAEAAFASAGGMIETEALVRLAALNVRRKRWADAAWLFDHAPALDANAQLKRCLARNMASLEMHRPGIYATVVDAPATADVSIAATLSGRPTVVCRRADGSFISLSTNHDPLAASAAAMVQLLPTLRAGQAFALCGMGDGYLLHALSRDETPLFCGMRQPVFVVEPDARVALHCLMLHDYSGPQGPIEQGRFFWFVGTAWEGDLLAALAADPYLGTPGLTVGLSLDAASIASRLNAIAVSIIEGDRETRREVEAHYAAISPEEAKAKFGPKPPRRPRVLLLTTRFSTVLQYSTRDAAEAFEAIGWEARVIIEPSPAHRLYQPAMRRMLADFKPDLLFQIDHLRHEHGDMFPANLPFACWAQDHLPNLTTAAAAARTGPLDFVLVGMPTMYVNRYGYPRRQCIALTKLTRIPARPARWASDGEDLVYVSTASQRPSDLANQLLTQTPAAPDAREVFALAAARLIGLYNQGGALPTHYDVRLFLEGVESAAGVRIEDVYARRVVIDLLFDRLGNLMYRQQGLAWAAAVAERRGLRLGIYGTGWDRNPQFARFARGPVAYGPALEDLTRRSKINLVLEPFFSPSHQRLLDGLAAGGFFLVRDHSANALMPELARFLAVHAPASAGTVAAVRAALGSAHLAAFDGLIARCGSLAEFGDPVEFVRDARDAGTLRDGGEALPALAHVSFNDEATLDARVAEALAHADRRADVSRLQLRAIEGRLSYAAGMRRVVEAIGRLLPEGAERGSAIDRIAA